MEVPLLIPTEQDEVVLRQLTLKDASIYAETVVANRDYLSQFGDVTGAKYPDLKSVEDSITNPDNPDKLRFGIWDGDEFVGSINLTPQGDGSELGYWLDSRRTGNGYATVATRALAGFAVENYENVHADVQYGNEASARVLRRVGFVLDHWNDGKMVYELPDAKEHAQTPEPTEYIYPNIPELYVMRSGDLITGIDTSRELDLFEKIIGDKTKQWAADRRSWIPKTQLSKEMRPPGFNGELRDTEIIIEKSQAYNILRLVVITTLFSTGRGSRGTVAREVTYSPGTDRHAHSVTRRLGPRSKSLKSREVGDDLLTKSREASRYAREQELRNVLPGGLPGHGKRS
jgi:RimJ/RimL family protein N-acetyltransferase